MGFVLAIIGGTVGFRTPMQTAQIQQAYKIAPAAALEAESVRMEKVNRTWTWYLAIWIVFIVLGLGLRMLANSDFLRGLGIALIFFAGVGLMIDGFADRRARVYSDALDELKIAS